MFSLFNTLLAQIDIGGSYKPPLHYGSPRAGIAQVGTLVSTVLSNVYIVAGVLLLILILVGGLRMISAAGSKEPQKIASARSTLTYAIIGFLIIFASYWIIQIIEAMTGLDILK